MRNQSSNNSVDKEISLQTSKTPQHSLVQNIQLKEQQDIRNKSNSSSQSYTLNKTPQIVNKNNILQRPSSVNQRPRSISKFTNSIQNEATQNLSNAKNRSQDDSYTYNSCINSMNNNDSLMSNMSDISNKSNQYQNNINFLHQTGYSMQMIKQPNQINNAIGTSTVKVQTSTYLPATQVEVNTNNQNITVLQQNQAKLIQEEQQNSTSINPLSNSFQVFSQEENVSTQELTGIKHTSAVDLPQADLQNISSQQQFQQQNSISKQNKIQNQQISKILWIKQHQKNEAEEGQEDYQMNEKMNQKLDQKEKIKFQGLNQFISGQNRDTMNQVSVNNQVNNSILGGNDSEKFELSSSSCSKLTSNSGTSRSQKNQSNTSDDSMQDLKQENLQSNSAIVSSSNNSSKIFKGSSNNSLILNQCTTKLPSSTNPEKGNLNDIQSKEEMQESIKSLRNPKPREVYILQNSRAPVKLIVPEDNKNQTITQEDSKQIISSAVISKPNIDVNESLIKQKHSKTSKMLQFMHRRGNTLSRSDIDELQFLEFQENIFKKHSPEDEKINPIFTLENKSQSEHLVSHSNKNQQQLGNQSQEADIKIRNNEEKIQKDQNQSQNDKEFKLKSKNLQQDNQDLFQIVNKAFNQDFLQEDKDEETSDLDIKKQLQILNIDDSENEENKVNNDGNQNNYQNNNTLYQPSPVGQFQHQAQFHPNINPFLDMSSSNTPQISNQQRLSYDSFTISQSLSAPHQQQIDFINPNNQLGARTMSMDQQYSQFFATQSQKSVINNQEQRGSPFQSQDFNLQELSNQLQQQQAYSMQNQSTQQQIQAIFNQPIQQSSPHIQFNQLHNQSPPVSAQQSQQNFQVYQQHPMQQMILQLQPHLHQHNIQNQQINQQSAQQMHCNTNQMNINQQNQQQLYQNAKGQKSLQLQNSLFSSNSNSTYHLQKQTCNLSQASTADSEPMNTFRSGSSFGMLDKQQEGIQKIIQQQQQLQQQQINQQQQAMQLQYISQSQSQQAQLQQQQQQQQIQSLNFFPNHPVQQDNKFFSQSNHLYVQESYPPANHYNFSQINPKQFQTSQQMIQPQQDYVQNNLMLQYQQNYIPQNNQQIIQNLNQFSPDKLNTVFSNPSLLNNSDLNQIHKNPYENQMNSFKPTHSKQLSCQSFGQFDQQNQISLQSQQQNIQLQKQLQQQQQNLPYLLKNNFNNSMSQGSLISSSSGNNLSGSVNLTNNNSQICISNSLPQNFPKGKKKSEIRDEIERNIIDLDKLEEDKRTTVNIKNIPNKYTLNCVLQTIQRNHRDTFDFFYLPIDFQNKCNVGYAFINFIKPEYIREFFLEFNGKKWKKFNSDKLFDIDKIQQICDLKYARIQGREKLLEHFENSSVMNQKEKKVKPVFFSKISEMIENQRQLQTNPNTSSQNNLSQTNDSQSQNNNRIHRSQNSIHSNQNNTINEDINNSIIYSNDNRNRNYNNNQQEIYINFNQNNTNVNSSNITSNNNNDSFIHSQNYQNNPRHNNTNNNYSNRYNNQKMKNQNNKQEYYIQKQ